MKYFFYSTMRAIILIYTVICLTCGLLSARGVEAQSVNDVKISLSVRNESLVQVLKDIESRTSFRFVINASIARKITRLNLEEKDRPVGEILSGLLTPHGLTFEQVDKNVVIRREDEEGDDVQDLTGQRTSSPASDISGTVTDQKGEPLEGASVLIKGTQIGTTTDATGKFKLTLPTGSSDVILVVSFLGYQSQSLKVNGGMPAIVVTMTASPGGMNEAVIVGYGTQKRSDLTGAITTITPEDLNQGAPNLNVAEMLEGRVAGLYINQHGADPGTSPTILIRGNGSLNVATATPPNANNPNPLWSPLVGNSADPLVIVDGFPLTLLRDMNTISPNDIKEITVLKDASATAIYGSRGANGVIIITTKTGRKNGKLSVNYGFQASSDVVAKEIKVMNDRQYLQLHLDLYADSSQNTLGSYYTWPYNQNQVDSILATDHGGTDWQKAAAKKAATLNQTHHLTLSGGGGPLTYVITGDYLKQYDNIAPAYYERYYGKSRVGYSQGKLNFNVEATYTYENRNAVRNDYNGCLMNDPSQPVYDSAGHFSVNKFNPIIPNPIWEATVENSFWNENTTFLYGDGSYEILPGLHLRTDLGLTMYNYQAFNSTLAAWNNGKPDATQNNANVQYFNKSTSLAEVYLDYTRKLNRKNSFSIMVGGTDKGNKYRNIYTSAVNFASTNIIYYAIQAGQQVTGTTSWVTDKTLSEFGRITYNYDDRYLLTANFRADGATQFGQNNKYGYFPSAAVAWRIDRESFMQQQQFFQNLKLRVGYGTAGNDNIPSNLTSQYYSFANYNIGGGSVPTIVLGSGTGSTYAPNPNLKWEQVHTFNLGLDFKTSFMNGSVDYYLKNSDQLLLSENLPPETGHSNIIVNNGQVRNKGIEATIGFSVMNIFGSHINWFPMVNVAHNVGKILNLGGDSVSDGNIWNGNTYYGYNVLRSAGHPFYDFFTYHYDGVWQQKEAAQATVYGEKPGDPKIRDVNNDGVIDNRDRYYAGDGDPHLTLGFANRFTFKRFDLSVFFQGVYGNKVFNETRMILDNPSLGWYNNLSPSVINRWTPTNPSNTEDSKLDPFSDLVAQSDKYLESAAYFRLKEAVFGYNIPVKNNVIKTLRVTFGATNIFTITKYSGLNPDVLDADNQYNLYPYTRTFTFGLNLGL